MVRWLHESVWGVTEEQCCSGDHLLVVKVCESCCNIKRHSETAPHFLAMCAVPALENAKIVPFNTDVRRYWLYVRLDSKHLSNLAQTPTKVRGQH
jgi:hypothetical protein